jgi:hypothetical protein
MDHLMCEGLNDIVFLTIPQIYREPPGIFRAILIHAITLDIHLFTKINVKHDICRHAGIKK